MPHWQIVLGIGALALQAQPTLTISPGGGTQLRPGEQAEVYMTLSLHSGITALQWEESLDDGLAAAIREVQFDSSAAKQLQCHQRCVLYGLNTNPLPSGILVRTSIRLTGSASAGRAYLRLANVQGVDATGALVDIAAPGEIEFQILEDGRPSAAADGIVNAASYAPGLVPGGLAILFGSGLSPISGTESAGASLNHRGVSVSVNGRPAALISIGNQGGFEQINFQTPFESEAGLATVEIDNNGRRTAVQGVEIYASQPGVFEIASESGGRMAAAVDSAGRLVSPSNPARRGSDISLYFTGGGRVEPFVASGAVGPVPPPRLSDSVRVTLNGVDCPLLFAGYAPFAVGVYQLNFRVPVDVSPGDALPLLLQVGGYPANPVRLPVQ